MQADGAAAPSLSTLHRRVKAAIQDFESGPDSTGYDSVAASQGRILAKHLDSKPPVRLAAMSEDSCDRLTPWNSSNNGGKLHSRSVFSSVLVRLEQTYDATMRGGAVGQLVQVV
jgi:hypothetical protein